MHYNVHRTDIGGRQREHCVIPCKNPQQEVSKSDGNHDVTQFLPYCGNIQCHIGGLGDMLLQPHTGWRATQIVNIVT